MGELVVGAAQQAARNANDVRQETAKKVVEAAGDARRKAELNIYKPVFEANFDRPKMIVIADKDDRKDIEVFKGAIGWSSKAGSMDVLHLYDEVVPDSGIVFYPQPQLGSIYYQDALDGKRYISLDCYFDTVQKDKLTELKRIAFELGAKSCRLESYEEAKSARVVKAGAKAKHSNAGKKMSVAVDADAKTTTHSQKSIVFNQTFEGNDQPRRPELRWFANNQEIEFLIDTRCNGGDNGKTKEYSMQLSNTAMQTMNVQTAIRIDKALAKLGTACNFSLEGEALTEQRQRLVFEIEF